MSESAVGMDALPLPEIRFSLEVEGATSPWEVVRAHITEGLSDVYECALEIASVVADTDPTTLVGQAAVFAASRGFVERRVCGIIATAEDHGMSAGHRVAEVLIVPAMWALSQRSNHRVFQDIDAVSIVKDVLRDAGMYQGEDGLLHESLAGGQYPPREYCVQYGETDLAFIRRLLHEEGIAFAFEHDDTSETLVFLDTSRAQQFASVRTIDGGPVEVMGDGSLNDAETIGQMDWARTTVPTGVTLRDYDFTSPTALSDSSRSRPAPAGSMGPRVLYDYPGRYVPGPYAEGTHTYGRTNASRLAMVRLESAASPERAGRGQSNVVGLIPGAIVAIVDPGREDSAQRYLVTRVTHTGNAPEVLPADSTDADSVDRYSNTFDCVPADGHWRPPTPDRVRATGPQSAVVMAEPGST